MCPLTSNHTGVGGSLPYRLHQEAPMHAPTASWSCCFSNVNSSIQLTRRHKAPTHGCHWWFCVAATEYEPQTGLTVITRFCVPGLESPLACGSLS